MNAKFFQAIFFAMVIVLFTFNSFATAEINQPFDQIKVENPQWKFRVNVEKYGSQNPIYLKIGRVRKQDKKYFIGSYYCMTRTDGNKHWLMSKEGDGLLFDPKVKGNKLAIPIWFLNRKKPVYVKVF